MNYPVTIELSVRDPISGEMYRMAVDSKEFPLFSLREIEDLRAPIPGLGVGFDVAVDMIRERQFRRDMLIKAARALAGRMADHIEDSEGWHGEKRREIIEKSNQ